MSETRYMYRRHVKRFVDCAGALVALLAALGPMVVIAGLIRWRMGSPVVYESLRAGLHGRTFVLYKFRTMAHAVDASGELLPDRNRTTPLGRLLRRTSLDELPQLVNVLKGDMSLVGPRPLNARYLDLYSAEQARRHDVRPGLTGLAQVNGRNRLSWNDRFTLDVRYVQHVTLLLDLQILARTIIDVFQRRSVSAEGDLDVSPFTGNGPLADSPRL